MKYLTQFYQEVYDFAYLGLIRKENSHHYEGGFPVEADAQAKIHKQAHEMALEAIHRQGFREGWEAQEKSPLTPIEASYKAAQQQHHCNGR